MTKPGCTTTGIGTITRNWGGSSHGIRLGTRGVSGICMSMLHRHASYTLTLPVGPLLAGSYAATVVKDLAFSRFAMWIRKQTPLSMHVFSYTKIPM